MILFLKTLKTLVSYPPVCYDEADLDTLTQSEYLLELCVGAGTLNSLSGVVWWWRFWERRYLGNVSDSFIRFCFQISPRWNHTDHTHRKMTKGRVSQTFLPIPPMSCREKLPGMNIATLKKAHHNALF